MLPERRGVLVGSDLIKTGDHNSDHGLRAVRRSRRSGRMRLLFWLFSFAALFSICIAIFGFKMFFHGVEEHQSISSLTDVKDILVDSNTMDQPKKKLHRALDRFTSRDQLSFGYTFLKLRRMNLDNPLVLHMFKDCERRAITKLFHHRNP